MALAAVVIGISMFAGGGSGMAAEQKVAKSGNVRVYYHSEGIHAVDPTDRNGNGVPDRVDDLLTQTEAARTLWVKVLGFPDPFETERFRSARFLDIQIRDRSVLKTNGVAYDELQYFKREGDPKGTASLCFNVASSVNPASNLTPAHEYFHLIQNGATFFKNRWYTEGLARWSEGVLGAAAERAGTEAAVWPLSPEMRSELTAMSYDAAGKLWEPLLRRYDQTTTLPETAAVSELQSLTYTDGTKVLADLELGGWRFVRGLLEELGKADDVAFRELAYDRWSEANQKSPKNDAFILRAIGEVIEGRRMR